MYLKPRTAHLHAAAVLGREVRAGDVVVRAVARAAEVPLPRGAPVVDDPAADQSEVSTGSRDAALRQSRLTCGGPRCRRPPRPRG